MIQTMWRRYGVIVCSVFAWTGCNDPRGLETSDMRRERIAWRSQAFADREQEGDTRLAAFRERIDDERLYRAELWQRTCTNLDELPAAERQRWRDRQPYYRTVLGEVWRGRPQHARDTIPLFY